MKNSRETAAQNASFSRLYLSPDHTLAIRSMPGYAQYGMSLRLYPIGAFCVLGDSNPVPALSAQPPETQLRQLPPGMRLRMTTFCVYSISLVFQLVS